jgi:hypothetical protein
MVTGERGADQHHGPSLPGPSDGASRGRLLREVQQTAERLFQNDLFDDRNLPAVLFDLPDVEPGLLVRFAEPVEQFVARGEAPRSRNVGKRTVWVDE